MRVDDFSRRRLLAVLGAGGVAGLAGCAGGPDGTGGNGTGNGDGGDGDGNGDGDQGTAALQQRAVLGFGSDPTADFWSMYGGVGPYRTRVHEPLIWVNPDFTLEPWLATEWEQTGDVTWEFTIRDGVKFHNGDTLNADLVVFSIEKLLEKFPQAQYTWRFAVEEGTDPPVPKVKALDDMTVEFTTSKPFPVFDAGIAHNMVAIQHPETDAKKNEIVATGPYQVEAVEAGQHVKVSRFDDYWQDEKAETEQLTYRAISDPNTRALSLRNHEVDLVFNPPRSKFESLNDADNIVVKKQIAPRWGIINVNLNNPPTDDRKLRRALNVAVDQKAIVETVLNGIGEPARAPIGKIISWSAHDELPAPTQDKEKARQLVEESSYDGEPIDFRMTNNPEANWAPVNGQELAAVVQQAAKEVGVTVEINAAEYSAFTDAWSNQEGNMYLFEWGTKSGAADYVMFKYHSRENPHHSPGEEFDAAIERGETAKTQEEKKSAYVKAQKILMNQGVVVPIYYKQYLIGMRSDVEGFQAHPLSQMTDWRSLKHRKE